MVPKFRAWDEIQHKMLQVDYIEFIDGKAYWVEASSADDNPQGGNDGPVRDNSQLKLEQSTGLKDVNGKEIYENDIVKMHIVALSPDDKIGYVEHHKQYGYSLIMGKRRYRQEYWATDNQAEYEVIGNVHESPELLEAQHD
ncbi:hypothetical protein AZI11_14545 (plasmid) [Levilactobacillus brevis]|nr:hypothetical protein AZI11_14545 [Levilactobacillus brevis]